MARASKGPVKEDLRSLSGPERAAIFLLSLGEEHGAQLWEMLDEDEVKEVSQLMSNLGTVSSTLVEKLLIEFVSQISSTGSLMGSYESTERLLAALPADRQGRPDHGGNPRSGRPHHVGQARQRERVGARQLSEERIPADRRRGAVQDQVRARRARARRAARGVRARSRAAHAAHGIGAEGHPRQGRADAAHRVHVESRAHRQARRARNDGGDLQQFRPPDRKPLPDRARRAQPRSRRAHQGADVHLRGSRQARSRLGPDAAAPRREGQARASRSRAPPTPCATCSSPT